MSATSTLASLVKLADLEPAFFLQLLAGLLLIAALVLTGKKLADEFRHKGDPPKVNLQSPLPVKWDQELSTKSEVNTLRRDVDADLERIRAALAADRLERRAEQEKIHSRIDALTTNTGEIKGELKSIAENVQRLLSVALQKK